MSNGTPVAPVVQAYLRDVLAAVNAIEDPNTNRPLQIPDFAEIYQAAGRLDDAADPGAIMWTINTLLGRASSVGSVAPTASYALSFPDDHHMHADMGLEWYWVGCHMNVMTPEGETGRVSLACEGQLYLGLSPENLKEMLVGLLSRR